MLLKNGFEVFLPMQKVMRQWTDRKKKVEVPLFNSYIFVKEMEHNIQLILQTPGVAWNIRYNGKPAVLRLEEYEIIERFITTGYFMETAGAEAESFKIGDKAKVVDGPLMGMTGTITGEGKDQKFGILLEGIQQVIRIQMPANLMVKY